jgi:hypothetical protein
VRRDHPVPRVVAQRVAGYDRRTTGTARPRFTANTGTDGSSISARFFGFRVWYGPTSLNPGVASCAPTVSLDVVLRRESFSRTRAQARRRLRSSETQTRREGHRERVEHAGRGAFLLFFRALELEHRDLVRLPGLLGELTCRASLECAPTPSVGGIRPRPRRRRLGAVDAERASRGRRGGERRVA